MAAKSSHSSLFGLARCLLNSRNYADQLVLDIGGEGRYPQAWNVNPSHKRTCGPRRGAPIPRRIAGRADAIPFRDGTANLIIVERTPIRREGLREIQRVVAPDGLVVLCHAIGPSGDPHGMAKQALTTILWEHNRRYRRIIFQETLLPSATF